MKLCRSLVVLTSFLLRAGLVHAQEALQGSVEGVVTEPATHAPLENASVVLRSQTDSTRVVGTVTGKDGAFAFPHVPLGAYVVECSLIGHVSFRSPVFVLSEASPRMVLKSIALKP